MHSIFFTVGKVRTDIGVVLSDAIVAANPSSSGRGAVRLYNVDDNQVTPGGGCWAWSNMNGTKMQAVVTGWS